MINEKKIYNNPYHPYPYEMKGQFFEKNESGKTLFIEIYSIEYNQEIIQRYKKQGVWEHSKINKYLNQMIRKIENDDEIFFLYQLCAYYANPTLSDEWEFSCSVSEFEQYVFPNFDELLDYVNQRWGIELKDFVPINETNIPH